MVHVTMIFHGIIYSKTMVLGKVKLREHNKFQETRKNSNLSPTI